MNVRLYKVYVSMDAVLIYRVVTDANASLDIVSAVMENIV